MKRRHKLQPVAINPLVVDLSHHNDVADFGKVKAVINAKEFLLRVEHANGCRAALYSIYLIKEQLDDRIDGFLAAHRLWLAQYGPRPVTPRNWPSAWLWQLTGDGFGPHAAQYSGHRRHRHRQPL